MKVKINNEITIDNLELNGNNFIPKTEIKEEMFDNLREISIIDSEGNEEVIKNAKVIFSNVNGKQSFIIVEKSKEEVEKDELKQLIADLTEIVLLGGI